MSKDKTADFREDLAEILERYFSDEEATKAEIMQMCKSEVIYFCNNIKKQHLESCDA